MLPGLEHVDKRGDTMLSREMAMCEIEFLRLEEEVAGAFSGVLRGFCDSTFILHI